MVARRGDFRILEIRKQIGDDPTPFFPSQYPLESPFGSNVSLTRTFTVGANVHEGYIMLQVFSVEGSDTIVKINGSPLPSPNLPRGAVNPPNLNLYWKTWFIQIPDNILQSGTDNTLEVTTGSHPGGGIDDIVIGDVVIHYREEV